jgi:hypothetical protein
MGPLPGVPTAVSRGGSWTLQRLEREVNPPPPLPDGNFKASAALAPAQVILRAQVDALDITVLKGGGPAVTAWVRQHGFAVSRDLPGMLDFYAKRSPIFLTATFDPTRALARGQGIGDGTPIQVTIPIRNPWVPLHILSLAKDRDDLVQADVFMLTDHRPGLLSGPGVTLAQSRPAEASLLKDLRSDRGMSWIAPSGWLSYMTVNSPASKLTYDLAADVSGAYQPSLTAAAIVTSARPPLFGGAAYLHTGPPAPSWWVRGGFGPAALILVALLGLLWLLVVYARHQSFHTGS